MQFIEQVKMAFRSIRSNTLRTVITMMIVAIGITALVGILTAIDTFIYTMSDNFSSLGANSFSIIPSGQNLGGQRNGRTTKRGDVITYRQAKAFSEMFQESSVITVGVEATRGATIKYKNKKTDPNVLVFGNDDQYLKVAGKELAFGRNFTKPEVDNGSYKCILGSDLIEQLFDGNGERALGEIVSVNSIKYKVIGVREEEGSSMNQNAGRWLMIPVVNAKNNFVSNQTNYDITVATSDPQLLNELSESAIGVFRNVRKLRIGEANNFKIRKSDGIVSMLKDNTAMIRLAAFVIALMTILSAAVGLMNIMLVSVTERTKEIGVSKALGAKKRTILIQFLMEATIICLLGGLVGTLLGILLGNLVSYALGGQFLIPWNWIAGGLSTCLIVGLIAGLYPAMKAANLDPIEALRYE